MLKKYNMINRLKYKSDVERYIDVFILEPWV